MGTAARTEAVTPRSEESSSSISATFSVLGVPIGMSGCPASDINPVIEEYAAFLSGTVSPSWTMTWGGHAAPTRLVINGKCHLGIASKWICPIISTKIMDRVYGAAEDFFLFHGAAAAWHDVLLAFPGDSGTGKSSVSISLAMNGWTLFSDEVIAISRAGLKVAPFPRAVAVWKNSPVFGEFFAAHPDWGRSMLLTEDRMKALIPFSQFNDPPSPLPLSAIVCLRGGRREVRRGGGQVVVTYWDERMDRLAKEKGICDSLRVEKVRDFWLIRSDCIEAVEEICTSLGGLVVERDLVEDNRPGFGEVPALEPISSSECLDALWSVFENGRSLTSCQGGVTALYLKLARLVKAVPCFWLRPGPPSPTCELLQDLAQELGKSTASCE